MKKLLFPFIGSLLVAFLMGTFLFSQPVKVAEATTGKEDICHNGVDKFDYRSNHGYNFWIWWIWFDGHNDYFGKCKPVASPSATPVTSPSASPVASPTPSTTPVVEVTCEGKGNDENGHPCGWSPPIWTPAEYKPAVCSVSIPAKPTFTYTRIDPTTVRVFWDMNDENTTHYSFSWGYEKDTLPYGALNVSKNDRTFDIGGLEANKIIWVEMSRWNGNECRAISDRIDP